MPKRKLEEDQHEPDELSVPLPIQTFLWRQTSPFIRPKIGKAHDASAMEQREACKSFEKVLVQNIQFGLSPSLTVAIKSIKRWRLVRAALPHVMHCCAALLYARKESCLEKLGAAETKLLYTLHWILLDAAEECTDAEHSQTGQLPDKSQYIFPITVIQVFVYLFAPLIPFLKQSDFVGSFRLENGVRIWEPLWEHRHPAVSCFTAPVQPHGHAMRAARRADFDLRRHEYGDVFIGGAPAKLRKQESVKTGTNENEGSDHGSPDITLTSRASSASAIKEPIDSEVNVPVVKESEPKVTILEGCRPSPSKSQGELAARPAPKADDGVKKEALTDICMATYLDVSVMRCLFISHWLEEGVHWALQFLLNRLQGIAEEQAREVRPRKRSSSLPVPRPEPPPPPSPKQREQPAPPSTPRPLGSYVALGRDSCPSPFLRGLPLMHSQGGAGGGGPPSHHTSMQELRQQQQPQPQPFPHRCMASPDLRRNKRLNRGDLRAFVEEGLRLSERILDRLGRDDDNGSSNVGNHHQHPTIEVAVVGVGGSSSTTTTTTTNNNTPVTCAVEEPPSWSEHPQPTDSHSSARSVAVPRLLPPRPSSALGLLRDPDDEEQVCSPRFSAAAFFSKSEMVRGKSLPSIHIEEPPGSREPVAMATIAVPTREPPGAPRKLPAVHTHSVPNPIITVTEHSPVASIQFFINQDSAESPKEETPPSPIFMPLCHQLSITRSQTDSNIIYSSDDFNEASGSTHYITPDGRINLSVVLKAVHAVTLRDTSCSLRVCGVVVSIVELLLNLGVLPKKVGRPDEASDPWGLDDFKPSRAEAEKRSDELSTHNLFVDSIIRVIKHLGCPHGCGEGHRSSAAETVRRQAYACLLRLHRADEAQFRRFLRELVRERSLAEVLDVYHAFMGFCAETGSLLSPITQKRTSTTSSQDGSVHSGYANNFGAGPGGISGKGIEGVIVTCTFKALVTRLAKCSRELKNQENMSLYCDLRQLISYVHDNHGGIFRRVALSGMLDSADRPNKKKNYVPGTRIVRHAKSLEHEELKDPLFSSNVFIIDETAVEKSSRKSFFRKRGVRKVPSAQSIMDEKEDVSACPSPAPGQTTPSFPRQHRALTPRLSLSEGDNISLTPKHSKGSKFPLVGWLKGDRKSETGEEECGSSPGGVGLDTSPNTAERLIRRSSGMNRTPKMPPKSASHMSLTFLRARRRMEDQLTKLGFGRSKSKHGSFEEPPDLSRRNSFDLDHSQRDGEMLIMKESKLVNSRLVYDGMLRFAFLQEVCQPGTVPDSPLLAAALDLKAPVVSRAALFFECAHFVHRCNKGQWPTWMKLNLPVFRPSGPLANRGTPSGMHRIHILQRAAGKLFFQWAEAIGARLEEMLQGETHDPLEIAAIAADEQKRRQCRMEDEEEDFLDEASINPSGNVCPFALKMAACQLLLEITAFLRETYQLLPQKSARTSARDRPTFEPRSVNANRRWSMALSTLGVSQTSAHSLVSLAEQTHPVVVGERRISFVLHEADAEGESENSSNNTVNVQEELILPDEKRGRRIAQGRPHLLRRTGGSTAGHNSSFKRCSLKLKKPGDRKSRARSSTFAEDEEEGGLRRTESIKSRRKVSAVSDRSDTSERADVSGEESPGVLSDEPAPESPVDLLDADDATIIATRMPWLKVIVQLCGTLHFTCTHQQFCHHTCYRRQMRACNRLAKSVRKVYGDDFGLIQDMGKQQEDKEGGKKDKKFKKIITGPSSPLKRKASLAHNLEKLEKALDGARSLHSSATCLVHDVEGGLPPEAKPQSLPQSGKGKGTTPAKEEHPMLKYLKTQVMSLFHSPLSMLIKGTVVATEETFIEAMPIAWELLLENDQQLSAVAAVVFILAAVKAPEHASELLSRELKSEDTTQKTNALLRFQALWKFRYQCWLRMEEAAHLVFKVPPPTIEFTLPSPRIALDCAPVADPPWMPQVKTKVEEVTINQDQSRSFVTATQTRRKQQMELIHRALQAEEEKKCNERENFHISSVAVNVLSAYEPALFHAVDEHEEGDEDQTAERLSAHPIQVAHALFPSCLCSAAVYIINLLNDAEVSSDGVAVYEVAYKVIWNCLVEDTALFLRHFLERLTREKPDSVIQILRRLLRFVPRLPTQAAHTLYNYLVGYIMFYIRAPVEGGTELIANAISILWLVVPSVHGLYLKDLKQVLRKEQCDATLLITANVPSAKKIIVHGPDAGGIPSQFPIHEDTQFLHILQDSLDFFGIEENQHNCYFLVDTKTNQMHNPSAFVRDFYFFKRSQYPQLSLVKMDPDEAFEAGQQEAFYLHFIEVGKVLMSLAILRTSHQLAPRVLFLHDELTKLPSFPRKALEADFELYTGKSGKELLGMDTLHKMVWVKLMARMFEAMAGFFAHSSDIHLFLNVVNGALVLHPEDASILRLCMATYINAAHQFRNIFASNGYLLIMPTILQIYSNHQTNGLLCRTVEFICKQFYIMHRKPFILQMFGSVAPLLDLDVNSNYGDANKMQPKAFFQLLQSLAQYIVDPLDILELVDAEKPLRALDFCYQMDPDTLTILDAISLSVTVVSYASDSHRGHQMLTILEAVLPFYLQHLQSLTTKKETPGGPRAELQMIHNVSVCMKTLISNCEALTRNYTGPQKAIDLRGSSIKNASRGACSPPFEVEEDLPSRFVNETLYGSRKPGGTHYERDDEDSDLLRLEFRQPRDTLLSVVAEFLTKCSARLADLSKKIPDLPSKATELLDVKCHLRLAEVAHSLLKMAPYDPQTMACRGLRRYLNEVLPQSEWAQEAMRPALIMVIRRLDKTFTKVAKKPAIRRLVDWDAARNLLKGVYMTLYKHPYIAHLPHLKSLVAICQSIIVGDQNASLVAESSGNVSVSAAALAQSPPPGFCSVAVRLVTMQMVALGDSLSLESICGGSSVLTSADKTEIFLMNFILPLCIRVSSGVKDVPKMRQMDISFALTVVLNALSPPGAHKHHPSSAVGKPPSEAQQNTASTREKSSSAVRSSLYQIGFLGLKILIVCYERQLLSDWHRIARCIRELGNRLQGGLALWSFLDFVVTHRTPLYVLLFPLIKYKILQTICDNEQEYYYQQLIRDKIKGINLPTPKSFGCMFVDLVNELKTLKEDLVAWKLGGELERGKPSAEGHGGEMSQSISFTRTMVPGGAHRPSFTELTPDHQSITRLGRPPGMGSAESEEGAVGAVSAGSTAPRPLPIMRSESQREPHRESQQQRDSHRGLSIRLQSREGNSRRVMQRFLRRTSYPEEEGPTQVYRPMEALDMEHSASSEPRLFRKSTLLIKKKGSKKSTGSSSLTSVGVAESGAATDDETLQDSLPEGVDSTGEGPPTPTASRPQSPETGEPQRPRHRLQRQKAQSRKTFRFGKSRRGAGWAAAEVGIATADDAPPATVAEEEPEGRPRPTRASSIHGLPASAVGALASFTSEHRTEDRSVKD
ncbi:protein unc-80 homolog [Dermacentor andersoni]|uniref:protein unc-80 homolog n=1 Tax=Dermacentor andersoni TaxID=34620 RepID=UPI00215508CC|nr:protein unc-80 homolog [Dermacentor andersoni]